MTREEAIENITEIKKCEAGVYAEALELAIKALEQEPCEDAISRQAAIEALTKTSGIRGDALKAMYELPTVTVQEKTGRWIYICNSEVNGLKIVKCSECGKRTYGSGNYCPNCGAKMAESEDSE